MAGVFVSPRREMTMEILWLLFILFFRIGFFGFGSGFAMLPLVFQTVGDNGFLNNDEFSLLIVISQALPGPVVINAVSYTGFMTAGVPGSIVSVLAITLPSMILVSLVVKFLERFKDSRTVNGVFAGIRPVSIGLIGTAAVMISENTLYYGTLLSAEWLERGLAYLNPVACIIFAAVFITQLKTKINPFFLILAAAAAGAFLIC